jgi:hypothetical protein
MGTTQDLNALVMKLRDALDEATALAAHISDTPMRVGKESVLAELLRSGIPLESASHEVGKVATPVLNLYRLLAPVRDSVAALHCYTHQLADLQKG